MAPNRSGRPAGTPARILRLFDWPCCEDNAERLSCRSLKCLCRGPPQADKLPPSSQQVGTMADKVGVASKRGGERRLAWLWLGRDHAAINGQSVARDEGRSVRAQPHDGFSDFLGRGHSP